MTQDTLVDRSYDPFIMIDVRILDLPLTTEAFRMYSELKRYANKEGQCFPSYNRLAKIYKGSYPEGHQSTLKRKAIASIQELIDWGLLTKEKRNYGDTESPATNVYTLTPPSVWKTSTDSVSAASHKKRGSSTSEPPSSEGELGKVVPPANQGSSTSEPEGSSTSEPPSSGSSTLTRSKKLDPNTTRSKELEKETLHANQKTINNFQEQQPEAIEVEVEVLGTSSVSSQPKQNGLALPTKNLPTGSNVPECDIENRIQKYQEEYDRGLPIDRMKLIEWAKYRLGDAISLYRRSGIILSSSENDINVDFAMFVSKRNVKKGEKVCYQHGRNTIKKWERQPEDWDLLLATIADWKASVQVGRDVSLAAEYQAAQKPKGRFYEIAQERFNR